MNLEILIKYILNKLDQKKMSLSKTTLLKYVYLADYYYATENNGETFSKAEWKFISFGPFSDAVINEIGRLKTNKAILSRDFIGDNGKAGEIFSYTSKQSNEFNEFFAAYPEKPRILLGHAINNLGADFHKILEFVYSETQPMTDAKPYEAIKFSDMIPYEKPAKLEIKPVTGKVKKQAQELLKKIVKSSKESVSSLTLKPIQDDSYLQAVGSDFFEPIELRGIVDFRSHYGKTK